MSAELVELRATVAKQKQVIDLLMQNTESQTQTVAAITRQCFTIDQVQRAVNYWSMCDINQETITKYLTKP